jgi:hypothetical protein
VRTWPTREVAVWVRLCVDVEQNGNVTGWSVERHDEWGRRIGVLCGTPGPFDTVEEALRYAQARALDRWGEQGALFD